MMFVTANIAFTRETYSQLPLLSRPPGRASQRTTPRMTTSHNLDKQFSTGTMGKNHYESETILPPYRDRRMRSYKTVRFESDASYKRPDETKLPSMPKMRRVTRSDLMAPSPIASPRTSTRKRSARVSEKQHGSDTTTFSQFRGASHFSRSYSLSCESPEDQRNQLPSIRTAPPPLNAVTCRRVMMKVPDTLQADPISRGRTPQTVGSPYCLSPSSNTYSPPTASPGDLTLCSISSGSSASTRNTSQQRHL